jgi:hypothetical protein
LELSLSAPNFKETLIVAIGQGGIPEVASSDVIEINNNTINYNLFLITK